MTTTTNVEVSHSTNLPPPSTAHALRVVDEHTQVLLAKQFFSELLQTFETLTGIAEEHGIPTLADTYYLQFAILTGSYIEGGYSNIVTVVQALPSADTWMPYIRFN